MQKPPQFTIAAGWAFPFDDDKAGRLGREAGRHPSSTRLVGKSQLVIQCESKVAARRDEVLALVLDDGDRFSELPGEDAIALVDTLGDLPGDVPITELRQRACGFNLPATFPGDLVFPPLDLDEKRRAGKWCVVPANAELATTGQPVEICVAAREESVVKIDAANDGNSIVVDLPTQIASEDAADFADVYARQSELRLSSQSEIQAKVVRVHNSEAG